jgi:hypothetical protein
MLEYFGFYTARPEAPEIEPTQREAAVARAARLAERPRHTPSAVPAGRAWDRTSANDR